MSIFGSWINQNTQQPSEDESKDSENDKVNKEQNIVAYMKKDESKKQLKLWREEEKKEPWHDDPPKVKVNIQRDDQFSGLYHVNFDFTLGLPPEVAFEVLRNPDNEPFSRIINGRELLKNISRKVTSEDEGSGEGVEVIKELSWNFLSCSRTIPQELDLIENRKKLYINYGKKKRNAKTLTFMNTFFGGINMEPMYVDSKRLCKHIEPESREEYEKCSGGQGRIATKVKMTMYFMPSTFYNLPPISWYIRWFTLKTTKTLIDDLQTQADRIRNT